MLRAAVAATIAYGSAAWQDPRTGRSYVLATRRHTSDVALFQVAVTGGGTVTYHKVRTLTLPTSFRTPSGSWSPGEDPGEGPQAEGMVVDSAGGTAYIAQEDIGVWKVSPDLTGTPRPPVTTAAGPTRTTGSSASPASCAPRERADRVFRPWRSRCPRGGVG